MKVAGDWTGRGWWVSASSTAGPSGCVTGRDSRCHDQNQSLTPAQWVSLVGELGKALNEATCVGLVSQSEAYNKTCHKVLTGGVKVAGIVPLSVHQDAGSQPVQRKHGRLVLGGGGWGGVAGAYVHIRPTCISTYCLDWLDGKVVEKVPLGLGCVLVVRGKATSRLATRPGREQYTPPS